MGLRLVIIAFVYLCGTIGHFQMINLKNISRREAYIRSAVWFLITPFLGLLVVLERLLSLVGK